MTQLGRHWTTDQTFLSIKIQFQLFQSQPRLLQAAEPDDIFFITRKEFSVFCRPETGEYGGGVNVILRG